MINFENVKSVTIPNGEVKKIETGGRTLWEKSKGIGKWKPISEFGTFKGEYLTTNYDNVYYCWVYNSSSKMDLYVAIRGNISDCFVQRNYISGGYSRATLTNSSTPYGTIFGRWNYLVYASTSPSEVGDYYANRTDALSEFFN